MAADELRNQLRDVGKRILLQFDGSSIRRQLLESRLGHSSSSTFSQLQHDALADSGWLLASLPAQMGGVHFGAGGEASPQSVEAFISLARLDPTVAERFATHVRAMRLIELYGDSRQIDRVRRCVHEGGELAIVDPVLHQDVVLSEDGQSLSGHLTAPLPAVSSALWIVEASWRGARQWCVIEASSAGLDDGLWINATVPFSCLGEADSLQREPWIHGSTWRDAAIQLGLIYELLFQVQVICPVSSARFCSVREIYHRVLAHSIGARRVIDDAAAFVEAEYGEHLPDEALVLSSVASFVANDTARLALQLADEVVDEVSGVECVSLESAAEHLRTRSMAPLAPRVQAAFGRVLMVPESVLTMDRLRYRRAS